jgi:hypothetical protein
VSIKSWYRFADDESNTKKELQIVYYENGNMYGLVELNVGQFGVCSPSAGGVINSQRYDSQQKAQGAMEECGRKLIGMGYRAVPAVQGQS